MADVTSPLLQLVQQDTGAHNNDWGVVLNQQLGRIETAIAGSSIITVSTGTTILTADQALASSLQISGVLTGNVIVQVPALTKSWIVTNTTTGNFVVTMQVGSNPGYILPRGQCLMLWCDGANVNHVGQNGLVPIGSKVSHRGATVPPGYLLEDGSAVSRVLYAKLFAAISTTYGVGDNSTTFNLPNSIGRYDRGTAAVTTAYFANTVQSHTHALTDPGHIHGVSDPTHAHGVSDGGHAHTYNMANIGAGVAGGPTPWGVGSASGQSTSASGTGIGIFGAGTGISIQSHATGITISATGDAETMPNSIAGLPLIRYQ